MELTTRLSSKGQMVLPKAVREANGWVAGTELQVISRGDEVVLKARTAREQSFPRMSREAFLAAIPIYSGPPITDGMIYGAVSKEAKRRWHAKGN